jgi:hypothetical protein
MAWKDKEIQGKPQQGMSRNDKAYQGKAWQGMSRKCKAWKGKEMKGKEWQGMKTHGKKRQGMAWNGKERQSMVLYTDPVRRKGYFWKRSMKGRKDSSKEKKHVRGKHAMNT